ncbi:MlaE family ABC transporter permease [Candidatus Omnitrophota bacterium]
MLKLLENIGRLTTRVCAEIWDMLSLLAQTLYWMIVGPFKKKAVKRQGIFHQMVFTGIQSVIIVFFVAIFTGIVIAMQSAYQLAQLGATVYVAGLVSVSICRELGPVLTSLVIAGRVGAAITAEIGTMRVSEQVEALEAMALNPVRFLVVPRFLALVIMLPCLTALADLSGIAGGYLVGVFNLNLDPNLYMDTTFRFLEAKDVLTGIFKSLVFGIIIALVACHQGLNTKGGAEGVGKSTTVSVVTSFILIILADVVLTGAFYFSDM